VLGPVAAPVQIVVEIVVAMSVASGAEIGKCLRSHRVVWKMRAVERAGDPAG
jgi:hypothetical protein